VLIIFNFEFHFSKAQLSSNVSHGQRWSWRFTY